MDIRNYEGLVVILLTPDEADACRISTSISMAGESQAASSLTIPVTNAQYVGLAIAGNTLAARRHLVEVMIESGEAIAAGKVN